MAKYRVTMSCGHVEEIQLFGKMTDRDKKIEWLEKNGVCSECRKAQKEAEHTEATAKAAVQAATENLPELIGTEKQVNWAMTIRAEKLAEVEEMFGKQIAKLDDAEKIALSKIQCQAVKNILATFTDAKFWIDNRDNNASLIIRQNNKQDEVKAEIEKLQNAKVEEPVEVENVPQEETIKVETVTTENAEVENPAESVENVEEIKTETKTDLDESSTNIAYVLGRTFATLQQGINVATGESDIYYSKLGGAGMLCTRPATEMALLCHKYRSAMKKVAIHKEKEFELELCKVMDLLPAELPNYLQPTEQSDFMVGYYHQKGKLDKKFPVRIFATASKTPNANLQAVLESSREVIDDLKDED